jgi:hypothetical protein
LKLALPNGECYARFIGRKADFGKGKGVSIILHIHAGFCQPWRFDKQNPFMIRFPMKYFALTCCLLTLASPAFALNVCYVKGPETATCRETLVTLISPTHRQEGKGVACQQPDGFWKVVSGPGFGMSFWGRDTTTAYLGGSYMVNDQYYEQPTHVRYVVTRTSVCVPELPIELQRPVIIAPTPYPVKPQEIQPKTHYRAPRDPGVKPFGANP